DRGGRPSGGTPAAVPAPAQTGTDRRRTLALDQGAGCPAPALTARSPSRRVSGVPMSVHLTLTLDKVFLRARLAGHTFPIAGQIRPARPWDRLVQFGVLVFWPKATGWLRLSASATPDPAAGAAAIPFHDTIAGLDKVCAEHKVRRDQLAPQKFLEAHAFVVASLPQHNRVFLRMEVDTDDDAFRRAVRERRDPEKGELVQSVQLLF